EINSNCIKYLNRLSDYLFVLARALNKRAGIEETNWQVKSRKD
ncbi:MAG TPA: ATP:cob(I)alamin adenosyltransferase, partial [Trueperaceae bacterium]|nr:ATP:cob(I)alamin adenosyltransferase [Trueperaceae bacterium]